jgi:electron transfer DM13
MTRRKFIVILVLITLGVAWYLFRPERLFINQTVNEGFPVADSEKKSASSQVLFKGSFHGVAHETKGVATVYQLSDGKRVLRFTQFETSNGPEVQVYLVAVNDANDSNTVKQAGFVSLGPIKGNIGDQNYDLPADVDLAKYKAVTIWCHRFGVNFGTAPLKEESSETASMETNSSNNSPTALLTGRFHGVAHESSGIATIYKLSDGKRILRFTEFKTSNGPEVQVYLVAADDANDSDTVKKAGFVSLGSIKGNIGDQNYDLPADVDLAKYKAVTIWCRRFGVNFATAPLAPQQN